MEATEGETAMVIRVSRVHVLKKKKIETTWMCLMMQRMMTVAASEAMAMHGLMWMKMWEIEWERPPACPG